MRNAGSFLIEWLEKKKNSEKLFSGFKQYVREDRAITKCDTGKK